MARNTAARQQWRGFVIDNHGSDARGIVLEQLDRRLFRLKSTVRYQGETGLRVSDDELLYVDEATLGPTDLASVPGPFGWWASSYGTHTPAALIHDRFIGDPPEGQPGRPEGVTEQDIDRYFRFMLGALGVPFLRRWLMWAAVATRTRLVGGLLRRAWMILWFAFALIGIAMAVVAVVDNNLALFLVAAALPIPASVLWWKQAGAGLIIAYVGIPFLAVPSILAIPFTILFAGAEAVAAQVIHTAEGSPEVET